MTTANEQLRDAALRHQIGIRRFSAGLAKRAAELLEKADAELVEKLRSRLAKFEGRPIDFTGERWKALLAEVREARALAVARYRDLSRGELEQFAIVDAAKQGDLLSTAAGVEFAWATVPATQLKAVVSSRPFHGKFLKDWFTGLERADQGRLQQVLQLGLVQGEPTDDIVRRVVGTKANAFADGVLAITRRDAQSIVRTAVNHVSNAASSLVWEANADVIQALIWTATLDGRTTAICQARDGHAATVGDNPLPEGIPALVPDQARPPAHIGCRSVMIAYIDGNSLLGNRPFVRDTRTRGEREIDFRQIARQQGKPIAEVRRAWAESNIGQVPAATTYQDFLRRQPAAFQDEVLGKTKGKLFRSGGLAVDQFVDRSGNEFNLAQLAASRPEAFIKAGLDPDGF